MPACRISIFFTIVMLVWIVINVYVFWRVPSIPVLARVDPVALVLVGTFLWSSYIVGRLFAHYGVAAIAAPLEWIGANWLGAIFLIFISLFAVDVITGFGFLLPHFAPTLRSYALLAAVVLSVCATVQGFRTPVITIYDVHLRGLPPAKYGMVIAVATDMHVGQTIGAKWLSSRVKQIEALRPDLIILAGDIVEGDADEQELLPILRRLSAPLGVFAVTGNHEFYAGLERSVQTLESAGIGVLRDRWIELQPGLALAGVDDLTARRQYGQDDDFVARALAGRRNPSATIFVSHTPWHVEEARDAGVGLMLSGHTHDGQIWPFGYIARTQYPFLSGRYDLGSMTLIVCRDSGTWGPRMRLWRRSEILSITVRG